MASDSHRRQTSDRYAVSVTADDLFTGSPAMSKRCELADGPRLWSISGEAARALFHRWNEQPGVVVKGDLATGFCWLWLDKRGTRITVTPVQEVNARPPPVGSRAVVGTAARSPSDIAKRFFAELNCALSMGRSRCGPPPTSELAGTRRDEQWSAPSATITQLLRGGQRAGR